MAVMVVVENANLAFVAVKNGTVLVNVAILAESLLFNKRTINCKVL